jgi:hypothetical protein
MVWSAVVNTYLHISALAKVCAATNNVDAGCMMINDIPTVVVGALTWSKCHSLHPL